MPILSIFTNVPRERLTNELNLELANLTARLLGKPLEYIAVNLVPDQSISFGGTFEPCAFAVLGSIGKLGVEENKQLSNEIMTLIEAKLGISPRRFYIKFEDSKPFEIGFNKSTFHGLI